MSNDYEKAKATLTDALDYFRHAVSQAEKKGLPQLAVIAARPDGSGQIICRFECAAFFSDLAALLGVGEQTEDGKLKARAAEFLQVHSIKGGGA